MKHKMAVAIRKAACLWYGHLHPDILRRAKESPAEGRPTSSLAIVFERLAEPRDRGNLIARSRRPKTFGCLVGTSRDVKLARLTSVEVRNGNGTNYTSFSHVCIK